MDDLISRQAAIDKLDPIFESLAIDKIKALPSEQPTQTNTFKALETLDCISRLSEMRSNYNCFDETEEPYYRALSEAIQLASVQPEIIRCKDCKHAKITADGKYMKYCSQWDVDDALYLDSGFFCGHAERRTDEQT